MTTDNVHPSPKPNAWRIGNLTAAGVFMGISELAFFIAVLALGEYRLGLGIAALRTLIFLAVVFGNQATTYANRTRRRIWSIRPSRLLMLSSVLDLSIAAALANRGFAMAPLPLLVIGTTLLGAVVFAFVVDVVKVPVFNRLGIV